MGDAHSHRIAETEPSTVDTDAWRRLADHLRQNYVGILLTPDPNVDEDRFARPQWRGYLAAEDGSLREIAPHFEIAGD